MQDFRATPAEKKQMHLDILTELQNIMEITIRQYHKQPTAYLEERLRSLKETYLFYKENNL